MKAILAFCLLAGPCLAEVNSAAILAPRPPKLLSDYGFFTDLAAGQADGQMVPYHLATALFSDYAEKDRYIFTPAPAAYQTEKTLEFPVGAAIIKTFRYGDHKVETRVLVHQEAGWKAFPYVWNAQGTEAELKLAGADIAVQSPKGTVAYHVPNANQCKGCHVNTDKAFTPIGPKVRNLNTGGQLATLVAAGVLREAPADAPAMPQAFDTAAPVEARARAYLDVNCGHCHAPGLPADTSGLYLHWAESVPAHLGIMKRPVAAGRGAGDLAFDVVPGDPEASILLYRMAATDPGYMMPEMGRSLADAEGVALIQEWIAGFDH